jgi:ribosomal protein S18 acetylase RimI-like enzyme
MDALIDRAIQIRRRSPGDDAFLEQLGRAAFSVFNPDAGLHTRRLVERPQTETLVLTRDRERLGFLVLTLRGEVASIDAVAVLAEERGRGLGTHLMQVAERVARQAGCRILTLTTAQANVEALELFLKCGFRIERRLARYYAAGQDACVLTRRLLARS